MKRVGMIAVLLPVIAMGQDATGNAENGKRIFMKVGCFECHGTVGQGTFAGARIGPPRLNVQGLIRYVRRPGGQMPAFTDKVLSDQALTDIYSYLKSIPEPKAVKDIPLLDGLKNR